jgi:hypothetical protein
MIHAQLIGGKISAAVLARVLISGKEIAPIETQ